MSTISGTIGLPAGTATSGVPGVAANGAIWFKLRPNGYAQATGPELLGTKSIYRFPLSSTGTFSGNLLGNNEVSPSGSTYSVWVTDSGGAQIAGPLTYSLNSAGGVINFNAATPTV